MQRPERPYPVAGDDSLDRYADGADVWSMRFERPPGDIFEVQDEIAVQVTRALELSLRASRIARC